MFNSSLLITKNRRRPRPHVWVSKVDPTIQIIIDNATESDSIVRFRYYKCRLKGKGSMSKTAFLMDFCLGKGTKSYQSYFKSGKPAHAGAVNYN